MIDNATDFEDFFTTIFGDINRSTLSSVNENRIRFELGGEEVDSKRIAQALDRSNQILQYCLHNLDVWLRIVLWSDKEEAFLEKAGLVIQSANNIFRQKNNEEALYLYYDRFSKSIVKPVITSIINYDIGEEPSANITCYFINFEKQIVINIYDDRGMDIYSTNKKIIERTSDKFYTWLIAPAGIPFI
ncbi:DUF3885 domain-containing protein [Mucilaginibacter sp.]|jgi:hypothetical protein|uniref:DUF3885 domain-containing protein n=1 Tax=Mucilaginibacter sp. TaxID=1882438 RepID=UPI00356648EB